MSVRTWFVVVLLLQGALASHPLKEAEKYSKPQGQGHPQTLKDELKAKHLSQNGDQRAKISGGESGRVIRDRVHNPHSEQHPEATHAADGNLPPNEKAEEDAWLYEETSGDFAWEEHLFKFNETFGKKDYEKYIPERFKEIRDVRGSPVWNHLLGALSLSKYYLPTRTSSKQCQDTLRDLLLPKNWGFTIPMVDSWGKFPDGMLIGNYRPLGMYEECLLLDNKFHQGRYCFIQLMRNYSSNDATTEEFSRAHADLHIAPIVIEGVNLYGTFSYGTCMPSECTEDDMTMSLTSILEEKQKNYISLLSCKSLDDEREEFTAGDISLLVFIGVLSVLLLAGTAADIYSGMEGKESLRRGPLRMLIAFSLSTNFNKLFHINTKPPRDNITCIHGLRVFSMIWVIYAHQYIFTLIATSNIFDLGRKTGRFFYQIFANGTFSVDSFFFMSGLLVAYMVLKTMSKSQGKLNLPMFYIHRYLRLTPAIAMTAWFTATLSRFIVGGPYSVKYDPYVENCRNNWWTDLLYINNYANSFDVPGDGDCIGQAWYTATDTQIFIFMPLVLIPLYHYKLWGKVWMGALILISCIVPGSITVGLDFPPFDKLNNDEEVARKYFRYMYVAPFCRAGPYLIGIAVGYILHIRRDHPIRMKKWQVALGWFLSTALALTILFGIYNYNILGSEAKTEWTTGMQFFYGGFSRALWAVPLAWIVIACHNGYGGPVNWILSHPSLQPMSRLTYSMFLMGLGLQYIVILSNKELFYFSHLNKVIETCGTLFFAGAAAVILAIFIEIPFINLEKEILAKPGARVPKEAQKDSTDERNGIQLAIERPKSSKETA